MAPELAARLRQLAALHESGEDVLAEAEALALVCGGLPESEVCHEPADRLRAGEVTAALRIGPLPAFTHPDMEALRPDLESALLTPATQGALRERVRACVADAADAAAERDSLAMEVDAAEERVAVLRAMVDLLDSLVGGVA